MQDQGKTRKQLIDELRQLRRTVAALKESETQLIQARACLKEEAIRRRLLVDQSRDGIVVVDENGKVFEANQRYADMLGYTPEELLNLYVWDWDDQWTAEEIREMIREVDEKGDHFETCHRRKDGSAINVEISTNGSIVGGRKLIFCVCRDITPRKQAEAEKARLERQVQRSQKMETIGTLTAGIAHDFNNILGIIVGNAELAMDDLHRGQPSSKGLEEILTASMRARKIVRQLLTYSQNLDLEKQVVDLVSVLKESLEFLRPITPATIEIHQQIGIPEAFMLADPTQLQQVIMNLCVNAIQAMETTGGVLTIAADTIELKGDSADAHSDLTPGRYIRLTVRDTGPGIDPRIHDRIFDPYFTTKGVGKGSGMGLAVAHGIVKHHKGAIALDARSGEGAVFSIILPPVDERPQPQSIEQGSVTRGSESILLVDDEEILVKMEQQMLERLGYRAWIATTAQEALQLLRENPDRFDLVVTDMTMPKMTGMELFKAIKDIRKDIPVIITTGHSPLIDPESAAAMGLAAYLMKPLTRQSLADAVRKSLDHAKA